MKPKTIVPLVIGLGVGFFAIKMGIDMVQKAKGAPAEETTIVVSAGPIDSALSINEGMLSRKRLPAVLAPDGCFTDLKELQGRVTKMAIAPGTPITESMLAPPGSSPGLRAVIPSGYRAVSISVNEESAVAGFLAPGCRVDVLMAEGGAQGTTKVILTNAQVGAVGQSMGASGKDGKPVRITKSVTLFLRPDEARTLHSYTGKGKLRLALRGDSKDLGDSMWAKMLEKMNTSGDSAVAQADPEPSPAMQGHQHVVEVVRGEDVRHVVFDMSNGARLSSPNGFGVEGSSHPGSMGAHPTE